MAPARLPIIIGSCALLLAASCEPARAGSPGGAAISVRDDLGRLVALDGPPRRIASLAPGFTETLFAVGCGDRVAVRDRWSDYPAEAAGVPALDGLSPSAEHVAGFAPDLVLLYSADGRNAAPFGALGIPVAVFNPASFDDVARTVARVGALAGCAAAAEALAERMLAEKARIAAGAAADGAPQPLVYVEIDGADPARPWTAGPGSFVHELIGLAGGRNAAAGVPGAYAQLGAESLIRMDPDWILLLDVAAGDADGGRESEGDRDGAGRLAGRPGWGGVTAVREGRIIDWIDRDLVSRPGPRLAEGLELLAEALSR